VADLKKLNQGLKEFKRREDSRKRGIESGAILPDGRKRPFSYQATIQRNSRGDMIAARIDPIIDEDGDRP